MFNMQLNLLQRWQITLLIPTQGKYEHLVAFKDIKNRVELTQKEITEYEVKTEQTGNNIAFFSKPNEPKDYEFSDLEKEAISPLLKNLSEKGLLAESLMSLYELCVIKEIPTES